MLIDKENGVIRVRDLMLPGQVTVLAGRAGMGKTTLACDLLSVSNRRIMKSYVSLYEPYDHIYRQIQERGKKHVDMFDSTEDFFNWLVSVSNRRITMSYVSLREPYEHIYKRIQARGKKHVDMFDSLEDFFGWRGHAVLPDLFVVVDCIPCNESVDCPRLFEDLKTVAEEHMSSILVLSQLPRKIGARKNKRPLLRDLPMKDCLELIDNVIFLYRDDYYYGEATGEAEAIIAKRMLGKKTIPLKWNAEKASYL